MLTLPPDSQLFQMVPSLEKSQADMNQYCLTFHPHPKHPHVYSTYSILHVFPRQPDNLSIIYEKELVKQRDWIDQELENFHGDAAAMLHEVEAHACAQISHAIHKHLDQTKGKIVSFPFDRPRLLWIGEKGSRSQPDEREPVLLKHDPFDMHHHFTLESLQKYLAESYPIKYVNPYTTWAKMHKIIFRITLVLFFLCYALLLIPVLQLHSFALQAYIFIFGLLNLILMSISKRKFQQWEQVNKSRTDYTVYQRLFSTTAQSLHRELRFYHLWAQHANRTLPDAFDSWEHQLNILVDQFNRLPEKPVIRH